MPESSQPDGRKNSPPPKPGDLWILALFFLGFLALVFLEIFSEFTPVKAGALFFPLVWIPLVVLHEIGHAAMTRICGWRVEKFVVGFGRVFARFAVGRTRVELRAFPIEGFVMSRPYPGKLAFPRLKLSLIYAAGPGIEILLAFVLYLSVGDRLFSSSEEIGTVFAQSVCLAIGVGLVLNLIPLSPSGIWSDGQGIVMSWLIPGQWFKIWSRGEEIDLDSAAVAPGKPRVRRPPESL